MKTQLTKYNLFKALTDNTNYLVNINGVKGYISSIQREDGSGSSFNVTLYTVNGFFETVYVRTID